MPRTLDADDLRAGGPVPDLCLVDLQDCLVEPCDGLTALRHEVVPVPDERLDSSRRTTSAGSSW